MQDYEVCYYVSLNRGPIDILRTASRASVGLLYSIKPKPSISLISVMGNPEKGLIKWVSISALVARRRVSKSFKSVGRDMSNIETGIVMTTHHLEEDCRCIASRSTRMSLQLALQALVSYRLRFEHL
jgi:hypothetical protein